MRGSGLQQRHSLAPWALCGQTVESQPLHFLPVYTRGRLPSLWRCPRPPGLSRAVAAVLLCPVTVVKTRMEYVAEAPPPASAGGAGASSGVRATAAAAGAGAAAASSAPRYRDVGHALGSILRAEGVGGLFRGVVPTVLANAPYSGEGGRVPKGLRLEYGKMWIRRVRSAVRGRCTRCSRGHLGP